MMNMKEKQYEILGKALEIYRDTVNIEIDVNDFRNVVNSTIMAIDRMEKAKKIKNSYINLNINTLKNTMDIDDVIDVVANRMEEYARKRNDL